MAEFSKEINIECPVTCTLQNEDGGLQAEGQAKVRLESSGLSLFPESPESGGGELMVTYRNISDFSVGDYRISLLADGPYAGFFCGPLENREK